MLRIQSTVYPPCRIENKIKEGGLWYSAQQNDLLETSKRIINRKNVKTPKTTPNQKTNHRGNHIRYHRLNPNNFMRKLKDLTVKQFTKIFWACAFGSVILTFIYHLLFI